jgi:hypothetical protein
MLYKDVDYTIPLSYVYMYAYILDKISVCIRVELGNM